MYRGLALLLFHFCQDLLFLYLGIILLFAKLCYTPEKIYFLCHHNFMKKKYKFSKNEPVLFLQGRLMCKIRAGGKLSQFGIQ